MDRNLGTDEIIKIIIKHYSLMIRKAKTVFVLGCGDCFLEFQLKKINPNLFIDSLDIQDMRNEKYKKSVNKYFTADLNDSLPDEISQKKYDLIFCLEVIEHLENPWDLIRKLEPVISEEGHIILSTPNPLNLFSRIHYFINGRFTHFYARDMVSKLNHNNPVFFWELIRIAEFSQLFLTDIKGVLYPVINKKIFKTFINILILFLYPLFIIKSFFLLPEGCRKNDYKKILLNTQLIYLFQKQS